MDLALDNLQRLICHKTQKSPGELERHALTQNPEKDHQPMLI